MPLIDHYYGRFLSDNVEDLKEVYDQEFDLDQESTVEQFVDLVKRIPELARKEYLTSGSPLGSDSKWYKTLIEFINCHMPDGTGVSIDVEGPLPEFLPQLLEFVACRIPRLSQLSDSDAIWLGKLAALDHYPWDNTTAQENWHVVHSLFDAFDERNSQIY